VWGALDGRVDLSPAKADVYSFGCLAFEALTGRVLFQAESEMAQIAAHIAHDGFPTALRSLVKRPGLTGFAEFCFATLRHDPRDRPTASALRRELARLAPDLARLRWPIELA
jgi:serine/threonine protein kinase